MPGMDLTPNWRRYRQFNPSECRKGTFRTKRQGKNTQLVLCKKKKSRNQSVQSIRKRRRKGYK